MAFLISVGLNAILFAVTFSIDPRRSELSRVQRWAFSLLSPAQSLTWHLQWVTAFVVGYGRERILALVAFSVLVYAIAAWVALSLHAWWRRRA